MQRFSALSRFMRNQLRSFRKKNPDERSRQSCNRAQDTGGASRKLVRIQFSGGFARTAGASAARFRRDWGKAARGSSTVAVFAVSGKADLASANTAVFVVFLWPGRRESSTRNSKPSGGKNHEKL